MGRRLGPVLALTLGFSVAAAASPAPSTYADMAVDLLREYIRIDTTNPPGNEMKAALFFKAILEKEGIPVEIDEFAPGRANLLATLKGSGTHRPLLIANHMDVVPADASRWSVSPFSGEVKNGSIYGRGAVDMKSEGIVQLVAFIRLKRENVPLARDVFFLATADEEVDFTGAERAFSPQGFGGRLRTAEYAIMEGGENRLDARGKPLYFGVRTAMKAPFWLKLSTTGRPGHGSRPLADSALNRLVRALERIRLHSTAMRVVPTVERFLRDQAALVGEPQRSWYSDIRKAVADPTTARAIEADDPSVAAQLRDTVSITVVKAGYQTNVIPGTAEAELDVRLLPGSEREAFLAEMRQVIDDPSVEVKPLQDTFHPASESSTDTPLFRAIERVVARRHPGVPVTTLLGTGATESAITRPLGIVSYGFTSLLLTEEEDASQHADDERLSEAALRAAPDFLYDVLADACRR
jgi:acetylornithine deacetylase/succinyl-diaminopimelate desuccinylase-like protein